jgi:(R,R)-butanediol dehydrogenase/meso-butanediol dehydrogenase/diacetyl reductase
MVPDTVFLPTAIAKELRIQFSVTYALNEFQQALDAFDQGHVEPREMISQTIGLVDLPNTFEALRKSSLQTKVHIDPWVESNVANIMYEVDSSKE